MSGTVTIGTRKLWTCWQGTQHCLKRWIVTEIRWHRNVVSCGSAMQSVALLSISAMRLWASSDKGPRVSKKTCDWRRAYCTWLSFSQTRPLQHFLSVAHFATRRMLPVCEQLSSQVALRLDCHAINVKPSGLFPSSLLRPWGSLTAGVSARIRAQLSQAWRWTLADCFLQDNACWLRGSTMTPQGQEWASQIAQPRRRPTATHMALLWRCRPQALSGRVWCQSPLWGAAAANNLALWYGSLQRLSKWLYFTSTTIFLSLCHYYY